MLIDCAWSRHVYNFLNLLPNRYTKINCTFVEKNWVRACGRKFVYFIASPSCASFLTPLCISQINNWCFGVEFVAVRVGGAVNKCHVTTYHKCARRISNLHCYTFETKSFAFTSSIVCCANYCCIKSYDFILLFINVDKYTNMSNNFQKKKMFV